MIRTSKNVRYVYRKIFIVTGLINNGKLTDSNYEMWKVQIKSVLVINGLFNVLN